MKLLVLAIVLGVANPAFAQMARHVAGESVAVEQVSAEIPGALVEPIVAPAPKPLEASPALVNPLKIESPKPVFRARTADKLFWLHSAAFAGSVAFDAWSTSRFVNYRRSHESLIGVEPGICTEGNRSLGIMPTDGTSGVLLCGMDWWRDRGDLFAQAIDTPRQSALDARIVARPDYVFVCVSRLLGIWRFVSKSD
jgi:hypothetical protein